MSFRNQPLLDELGRRTAEICSGIPSAKNAGKLLVEMPSLPAITHANAVFSLLLKQARGLCPVWLSAGKPAEVALARAHVPDAEFLDLPSSAWLAKVIAFLLALYKLVELFLFRRVLELRYDGVKYGDMIYDEYLRRLNVATIRNIDFRTMAHTVASCIYWHRITRILLQRDDFAAVLVSHPVGIPSGVMLRSALRHGYDGYLRCGSSWSTFHCRKSVKEVYEYPSLPSLHDVERIRRASGEHLESAYRALFERRISAPLDGEPTPYSDSNLYFKDRSAFEKHYALPPGKKIVFVMLHAFTDYPHSHFRWMIFRDYFDWFIRTLGFAKAHAHVNWVFKQHPFIRYYRTPDVSFADLFANAPSHIVYVDENERLDTRSLASCADLVVTCLGSAGYEVPALAAIPSLTAGDNFYAGLGFALEPRTAAEYFAILERADVLSLLTPEQQARAQAAYLYINGISGVDVTACPQLTEAEQRNPDLGDWFWDRVLEQYRRHGPTIRTEVSAYVEEIRKGGFRQLNRLEAWLRNSRVATRP